MADRVENVIWRLTIDSSQLGEVQRRLQSIRQQQQEVERSGTQDAGQATTAANRRTRAVDAETAAIDRQTRALRANNVERERSSRSVGAAGGFGPIGRAEFERQRQAVRGNPHTMAMAAYEARRNDPRDHGNFNPHDRGSYLWANNGHRYGYDHLYGPSPSSLRRDAAGNMIVQRAGPYGSGYLPGGPSDPRGPLSTNRVMASPQALAYANRGWLGRNLPNFAGGLTPQMGISTIGNLGTALGGAAMMTDPNLSGFSRMAGGVMMGTNLADAYVTAGGMQGIRSFAGSTLGRASMIAAPVALGLEGARRYYQGEANYQAQIGAQYDWRFAMNNTRRDWNNKREDMQNRHRMQRNELVGSFRDQQYYAGDARIREQNAFSSAMIGTYADTSERVNATRETLHSQLQARKRQKARLESLRGQVANASPEQKARFDRRIQEENERLVAMNQGIMDTRSQFASDAGSLIRQRDSIRESMEQWEAGLEPIDKATYAFRRQQAKFKKGIADTESAIAAAGLRPDITAEQMTDMYESSQRNLLRETQQASTTARNAGDRAGLSEALEDLNEKQVTELEKLNENFKDLIEALKNNRPPDPKREGVNAVVNAVQENPGIATPVATTSPVAAAALTVWNFMSD